MKQAIAKLTRAKSVIMECVGNKIGSSMQK